MVVKDLLQSASYLALTSATARRPGASTAWRRTAGAAATAGIGLFALASGLTGVAQAQVVPGLATNLLGNASAVATGAGAVALGSDATATVDGSVAIGSGSVADRLGLRGSAEVFTGNAVTSANGALSVGAVGAERQIINVAGGTALTDAVNLGQLTAVGGNLATALGGGAGFNATTGAFTAPTYLVGNVPYATVGAALTATGALGVQYVPDATGAATAAIDLTKGGTLAPVSLAGLADGTIAAGSTAAVNGGQLYLTNQAVIALNTGQAGLVRQDLTTRAISVGGTTDGTAVDLANNAGQARTLSGVAAGTIAAGSTQAVNGGQAYNLANSVAADLGGGAAVTANGTVSAPVYTVGGAQFGNVGSAISALDASGIRYDVNAAGQRTNAVTLAGGDPNQPVVIHNVATGTARTDAANTGQVIDAEAAANAYTNSQMSTMNQSMAGVNQRLATMQGEIDYARREAHQGAAVGLAAASLRYDDRPGKFSVAAGGGYWRGEGAAAFGVGYTLPNGAIRLNATGAASGDAVGFGGGATFTLN